MFSELKCRTHYSFLRGASHPSELIERAHELGLQALAITDRDGVYGMPKAYSAWKALQPREDGSTLKLIVGSELTLAHRPPLTLLCADRAAYGLMCRMLTASHHGKLKGEASLEWDEFLSLMQSPARQGLFMIPEAGNHAGSFLGELNELVPGRVYLPLSRFLDGHDRGRTQQAYDQAQRFGLPIIATNDVHMHIPERRRLQDALTAIRHNCSLDQVGTAIFSNSERYLKSSLQMRKLFLDLPEAIHNTQVIAEQCRFSPAELKYRYPSEWIPPGETAQQYLTRLTIEGAQKRYDGLIPDAVLKQLEHELKLVDELGFADYFLTIWEIVEFARSRKILCQGRGSAANSIICYCLGITAIDPVKMELLFERFISAERGEPPDIDVDFEHDRREEVIQHIYEKYGRDRAGMVAAVITYRGRSARRDLGKALGIEPDAVEESPHGLQLKEELKGFPRHLSIHSGGFTLSADPLIETVPIEPARMEGRTIVQWDKEDLAAIGLLKVDVLALGMLTALRKSLDQVGLELYKIPQDDKPTYDMICRGETVGVFQIESRAQMGMLKRLLPRNFYDLVIEVAIVRPGPIVGQMVHPYLRRRRGQESSQSPDPRLEPILKRTLGVPLFQEQVMKMAVQLGGFTPGESDELRRAIGAWRSSGTLDRLGKKLKKGLLSNGLPEEFVERVFQQIQGFAEYGFPESHAASFALLAYASSYLKRHHPAEFIWALINSQPMGFYANHTLVDEVKRAGVSVFPIHPNLSEWDCALVRDSRGKNGIRIGWRVVNGLRREEAEHLMRERAENGEFKTLGDFIARTRLSARTLEALAMGEAFACFGIQRREALWEILACQNLRASQAEKNRFGEQFNFFESLSPSDARFKPLSEFEAIQSDYESYGLSTLGHPMGALRKQFPRQISKTTSAAIKGAPNGRTVRVSGLVIVRQKPQTAKGTVFATLEDEEGFVDLVLHEGVFEKYEDVFTGNAFLTVGGRVQADKKSVSLLVKRVDPLKIQAENGSDSCELRAMSRDFQ